MQKIYAEVGEYVPVMGLCTDVCRITQCGINFGMQRQPLRLRLLTDLHTTLGSRTKNEASALKYSQCYCLDMVYWYASYG